VTGERPLTAFLDANALYPAELRNLLMRLALAEASRPLWSQRVQKEWTEALARDRPDLPREKIERVRALMEQHIPEATVEDYDALVGQLTLPDDRDRHVLAAAIKGGAEILVTANLKHFPVPALATHGIEALHPDEIRVAIDRAFAGARTGCGPRSPAKPEEPAEVGRRIPWRT
jgi:hypothetical protein